MFTEIKKAMEGLGVSSLYGRKASEDYFGKSVPQEIGCCGDEKYLGHGAQGGALTFSSVTDGREQHNVQNDLNKLTELQTWKGDAVNIK